MFPLKQLLTGDKMRLDFDLFDPIAFLEGEGIEYAQSGKNIGSGWVGVETCPMCGATNNHFAISLETKWGKCFVCGGKLSPLQFISEVLHLTWTDTRNKFLEYCSHTSVSYKKEVFTPSYPNNEVPWPIGTEKKLNNVAKRYLIKRKFDPKFICSEYGIRNTGPLGDFKFRIIIPIILNGRIVSYQGRDYTEKQRDRYKSLDDNLSLVPIKNCVYNLDNISTRALFVEGVFDVWRLGTPSACLFGTTFTKKQLTKIAKKKLKKARVLFDPKALKQAEQFAEELANFIPDVKVLDIDEDRDPAEYTDAEARQLIEAAFL